MTDLTNLRDWRFAIDKQGIAWATLDREGESQNSLSRRVLEELGAIVERTEAHLRRQLNFGAAVIEDKVTQAENHWVRFDIQPGEQHAGGSLTITIEEPEPGALFLRFAYTTSFAANPNSEERAYIDYIKSAYHQSDLDCVRIIRTLAADGTAQ